MVVITTAVSFKKSWLKFRTGSNLSRKVSEVYDGKNL